MYKDLRCHYFGGGNTGLEVIQAGGEVEAPQLRTQLEIFASVPEACLTQLGRRGGGVVQLQPGGNSRGDSNQMKRFIASLCLGIKRENKPKKKAMDIKDGIWWVKQFPVPKVWEMSSLAEGLMSSSGSVRSVAHAAEHEGVRGGVGSVWRRRAGEGFAVISGEDDGGGRERKKERLLFAHTLQKDTTPSSWRQTERVQKGNGDGGGRTEDTTTRRQNAKARQVLDTGEKRARKW